MIAKLMGVLDSVYDGFIILNVSGVGYRVFCSAKTLAKMPACGEAVSLFIETQVREDAIRLFGFSSRSEQDIFNTLTVVQGVGAKVGMAILSTLSVNEIQMAVSTGDSKAFARVSGIGPKLAARLITELKGKIQGLEFLSPATDSDTAQTTDSRLLSDIISALVNFGYSRTEAGIFASQALKDNPSATLSDLIRLALKEIGKANA